MSTCSTHVLDAALGVPAAGLALALTDGEGETIATATTDDDGRVRFDRDLDAGTHVIIFGTGPWFEAAGRSTFYPSVDVVFAVGADEHYHVALLLGPYSYTTYRGS
jgi:5-hydroxyisourate hydrolase